MTEYKRSSLHKKMRRVAFLLEERFGNHRNPARNTEPLDVLIATLLSQHTNDANSHRAYVQLRKKFSTWEDVRRASRRSIARAIHIGGMASQKSARIKKILQKIYEQNGALELGFLRHYSTQRVLNILLSLDGVGVKTAACVLLFAFGRDIFPVDTHIHRICKRLGLTPDCKTLEQTFEQMRDLIPKRKSYMIHTNMIRFGREICRSAEPRCGFCPLFVLCSLKKKNQFRKLSILKDTSSDFQFILLDNI